MSDPQILARPTLAVLFILVLAPVRTLVAQAPGAPPITPPAITPGAPPITPPAITPGAGATTLPSITAPPGMPSIAPGRAPAAGRPEAGGAAGGAAAATPDAETQAQNVPPMYRGQVKAALEFIDAVKDRDPEALAEATALRAPKDPDVNTKHQKLFQAILDKELPDNEMETLATQFEGYQVRNVIVGRSTGRANVIFAKPAINDTYEKTVVVRKEKAGWKVIDFTGDRSYVGRKSRKAAH